MSPLAQLLDLIPGASVLAAQVRLLPPQDVATLSMLVRGLTGAALVAAVVRYLGAKGMAVAGAGALGGLAASFLSPPAVRSTGSQDFFGVTYR